MSNSYHKIQTLFKRNPETNFKTLLMGDWSLPEFEYLQDNTWRFDEKIDGTNIRVVWNGYSVTFQGKTDNAQIPLPLLKQLETMFTVDQFSKLYPDSPMTLYGEGYGAKIQNGGKYLPNSVSFILFDVFIGGVWLDRLNVRDIASYLEINVVPTITTGTLAEAVSLAQAGFRSQIADTIAEGIVMRPIVELQSRNGHRIISKLKYKDFGDS